MLEHYYTPRDLSDGLLQPGADNGHPILTDLTKPRANGTDTPRHDGYVSTLLRIQRAAVPAVLPRKIAGARRVARAASAPQPMRSTSTGSIDDELFQSITAIPWPESTSFEELRLEIYRQSLIATGTARPQPAFAPPLVIPPAFAPQFVERADVDADADSDSDVEMGDATAEDPRVQRLKQASAQAQAPFVFLIARCRSWEFGSSQN
ncbi:hypothetical protein B0H14DRAFT_2914718 [Mycena olivaceomarginata]|nr:hypothetical protein B0H14DRAFT_2914718 [Mycena olivaceomarginata]